MYRAFRNDPPTVGRRDAVRPILPEYDRVGGEQGYAGTGKTAMLNRALRLAVSVRDAGGGRRQGPAHLRRPPEIAGLPAAGVLVVVPSATTVNIPDKP